MTLFETKILNIKDIENLKFISKTDEIKNGKYLTQIVNIINNQLPLYLIFKPETIKYYKKNSCRHKQYTYNNNKWKYISNLINCEIDDCSNCLKFYESKNKFLDRYLGLIENLEAPIKKLINDNIQIIFYGNEISDYIIYKKLQIKFDFYYIPLEIYNYIKANIELKKTIQILELLGPKNISVSVKNDINNQSQRTGGLSSDILGVEVSDNNTEKNSEELNQDTEYNLKSGFFFSINDFIDYISNIKHIFMSKNDYDKDFELRYLIRSRIESFLNSYSRILYVKKLSAVEHKLQTNLKNVYTKLGLEYSNSFTTIEESIVTIKCEFYNIDQISTLDNLPPNEQGFLILKKMYVEPNALKNNIKIFVDKVLNHYKIKYVHDTIVNSNQSQHIPEMISINDEDINNYKNIYESIKSYNDIQLLLNYILNDVHFVELDETGFQIIKSKGEQLYLNDIRIFFKRVLKQYNIEDAYNFLNDFFSIECEEHIETCVPSTPVTSTRRSSVVNNNIKINIDTNTVKERQNTLFRTFDHYKDIVKYVEKFLTNPYRTSVNRYGFDKLKKANHFNKDNKNWVKNIRIFLSRFIEKHTIDIKYLEIYDKFSEDNKFLIFTEYDNFKAIQKEPNFYLKLNEVLNSQTYNKFIQQTKVLEKKYKRDIKKNKGLLNIMAELNKFDINNLLTKDDSDSIRSNKKTVESTENEVSEPEDKKDISIVKITNL
uniref:Uncharacterized protein n=1 Tax=viral metagenome TaxID=1070528 RepID=A0A6C0J036_9ZZZZ